MEIVLPLIDEHVVADPAWRYWLRDLAADRSRVMMPVSLDPTAYNMPSPIREMNFIRPAGLPLAPDNADGFRRVKRSLLKQVTEWMCRILLPRRRDAPTSDALMTEGLPKVSVFLSHAKADGTVPAKRIRDYIYSQTQLAAFYDENDIAFGSAFAHVIDRALDAGETAALIAVRSAVYALRPWCRREISRFRHPRLEPATPGKAQQWRLYPTLVVESIEGSGESFNIEEFGDSPCIGWNDADPEIEEQIITTVIREAMLVAFHAALGASIKTNPNEIVISWLPDRLTLFRIPALRQNKKRTVIYPGRGLSGQTLDDLWESFPKAEFIPFEERI